MTFAELGRDAALLMASLQASLRAQALQSHLDLSALIGSVNRLVHESSPTHFFASLFYAEYGPGTRVMKYVNAGHNPPIVIRPRNGSCEVYHLDASGMPVGMFGDAQFSCTSFQFEVGDVFVTYTDGITEAENRQREQWGVRGLENLLRSCGRVTSEQIIRRILDEVSAFANGQPQRDDMTLVVMDVQQGCDVQLAQEPAPDKSTSLATRSRRPHVELFQTRLLGCWCFWTVDDLIDGVDGFTNTRPASQQKYAGE